MSSELNRDNILLSTSSLSIGYRQKKEVVSVAEAIDFEIKAGELVALIGINGSGKSTLLKTLSGQIPALAGQVKIDNHLLSELALKDLGSFLSLVLTHEHVSKQLTVMELVALGRHPYTNWLGHLSQKDVDKVLQALSQVDLLPKKDNLCASLSDGQFQKVLIARALAQDTALILMDEPTTHLDMFHKAYVLKLLKSIVKNSHKSVLFASHEINLALQLCDRIILIDKQQVSCGSPSELIQNGAFNSLFPKDFIVFDEQSRTFKMKISED
ncbi:ABC transporter ATP-binding protein [Psychroflexus sp. YR1-1]|uniref:ABC transporter ATP-binding protein n=1 Tax=Psychroflexus aurantiacus TaxID=2709310 RepID=A0A6B3R2T6_9FLAO|nr:ABC transporter ATP-binding protein [Psychroflexus aurantiacus]NEV93377.1 ABC transporter ATP-binding protein [Psychroflexus aurantiacus]